MNKKELVEVINHSSIIGNAKALLTYLVMESTEGECQASMEKLSKVVGVKHSRNFKGVNHYLPGLVEVERRGKNKVYILNVEAIGNL